MTSVWNQQNAVDDVALIPYDSAAAVVTSNAAQPQITRRSSSVDSDGTRRATVVVPAATSAGFRLTDGTLQSVASLTVRATEFTVGANGKAAMPAILPPTSGYTYCVELSADETPAGASVEFSKPVSFYVENFLSLPVGLIVPAGYYDRNLGSWISSENGRVIKVLSVAGGLATVDANGDGTPDDAAQLAALGIDDAERQQIAALYAAGQTIWRVRITHFTPWDLNLPVGPPADATGPNQPRPQALWISPQCSGCDEVPNQSVVDGVNQSLSEEVPIVGTPFSLLYDSKRMGRAQNRVDVSLSGASIPASLHGIDLTINVAGKVSRMTFAPQTNLKQSFQWDDRDVYGRDVQGAREATVTVAWRYPAIVLRPQPVDRAWATTSDQPATDRPARGEYIYTQSWTVKLGEMSAREAGFGAWTFSGQQLYDGRGGVLYDAGETRAADPQQTGQAGVFRVAGNGQCCDAGDGVSATSANINPWSTAIASDGSIYLSEGWKVKKVDTAGVIRTIAGTGVSGFTADGAPAAGNLNSVSDIALGPDDSLYLNDAGNLRVRHVVNGLLTTVAGNGQLAPTPMQRVDGVLATTVPLYPSSYPAWNAGGIAVGPDGTLYIAEKERVTAVGPDGIIHTIAGPCTGAGTGDGGPAVTACVAPQGIAVGPDGSVFISDDARTVRRITPDGKINRYAGTDSGTIQAIDGGLATAGSIQQPRAISVAPDGTLLIGGWRSDKRIRAVGTNGIITTFAGRSGSFNSALEPDGSLARGATMSQANDVKVGPDGSVVFADSQLFSIRKTAPLFPRAGSASTLLPSSDGTEGYVFENGRHVRTVDTLTGVVLFTLAYDTNGYLATVTDRDGNVTSIERDAAGGPTAIVAPGGQRTLLTVSGGYLTGVSNPAGESQQYTYDADGLLQSRRDARGNVSQYTWDDTGRLQRDADPAGGSITLTRSGNSDVFTMTRTTAEGRSVQHAVSVNPDLTDTRTITLPSGLQVRTSLDARTLSLTTADGTTQTSTQAGDPRFGMRAPLTASASVRAPSGLTMQIAHTQQVTLSNPLDPLSVTRVTDTTTLNGRNYLSVYDATLRQFSQTTPAGRTSQSLLDAKGRLSSVQRPGFATSTLTYDTLGRLGTIAAGSRTMSLGYNSKNEVTSITDSLQRTLSFAYDGAGRVVTQTLPDGRVIQFAYDANGNVTSVTPPSRPAHAFQFTAVNLTSNYSAPDPAVTQYTYNRDRQLTLVTKPDATTLAFAYDNFGRLSTITTAAGIYQYAYSSTTGNLASITTPDGNVLSYTFDGNLFTRSQWSGAIIGSVALAYDTDFRVTSENGAAYAYDRDSLLITAGALSLRRDAQTGLLSGTTLGGVTDSYAYNEFGEVTHYAASAGGNPVLAIDYTRDAAGRISSVAETMGGTTTSQTFTYDPAGRLTDATSGASTTHYAYDGNGNRLSRQSGTLTETGTYDAGDRVLTYGDATYTYTANGELKTKVNPGGTTTYAYDPFGNLQKVTLPDGTLVEYVIDGQGRRIEKKVDGQFGTGWIYGDQNRIVAQTDAQGNVTARYIYGSRSNVPDYVVTGTLTLRIISDHVGSPRFVINTATNEVLSSFGYDEFGNILAEAGNTTMQPFRFAGGLYDYDTGLLHFGARDVDPHTGRWAVKDPILFGGGDTNLYGYVVNDPVNGIDPWGLQDICIAAGRTPFWIRTPTEIARAQAARGMPRPTPPPVPRPMIPEPGDIVPPGPVEPVETQNPTFLQKIAKALAGNEGGDVGDVIDWVKGLFGGAPPVKTKPTTKPPAIGPSCFCRTSDWEI